MLDQCSLPFKMISDRKLTVDHDEPEMELKKVKIVTLVEFINRYNTQCEQTLLSILNLPINIHITDKVSIDIILDRMTKPTSSLFSAFIKIRLNQDINTHVLIATKRENWLMFVYTEQIRKKYSLILKHTHKVRAFLSLSMLHFLAPLYHNVDQSDIIIQPTTLSFDGNS